MNKNNTVLFGGSFNPPTIAHEVIIDYLSKNFKEVIILPNSDSYKFLDKSLSNFNHRCNMLNIISNKYNNVVVSRYEETKVFNGVVNTLEDFNHPVYVIGDDCLDDFDKWIDYKRLLNDNTFILFNRGNKKSLEEKIISKDYLKDYIDHFNIITLEIPDVSSTEYRTNKNEKVVSKDILDYIKENNLY